MSRFWPHPTYGEDQPYGYSILTMHVLTRAVTTGSIVGAGVATTTSLLRNFRVLSPRLPPLSFTRTLLRSSGVGAVAATGLLAIGLPARMWEREEVEWQDRSWRLLENKGQVECDDWTYGGMAIGALGAAARGGLGWKGNVGLIGAGSVGGMVGYMGWRYGLKGGKFEG